MRVRLITLRYSSTLGGFDESALQTLIRDKEVLAFREHFFQVNDIPHLLGVVTYQEAPVASEGASTGGPASSRNRSSKDPAARLDERGRTLFNSLREWRAAKAREEGVPPYVILTNRQLVAIIEKHPESPTALSEVEGVGPAKVQRHGADILRHFVAETSTAAEHSDLVEAATEPGS